MRFGPGIHRSWIFPRAPDFEDKAGRVLDLYYGEWEGVPLNEDDFVLCADEKTSIQARRPKHVTVPPRSRRLMRVEHEYERLGAWAYLAAWDLHRAKLFGRCEPTTGIEPFDRLVADVMAQPPYCDARRVFWIVDNGSSIGASDRSTVCSAATRKTRSWSWSICPFMPAG